MQAERLSLKLPNLTAAQAMMDLLASTEFHDIRAEQSSGRGSNGESILVGLTEVDTLNMLELDFEYLPAKNTR